MKKKYQKNINIKNQKSNFGVIRYNRTDIVTIYIIYISVTGANACFHFFSNYRGPQNYLVVAEDW